MEAPRLEEGAGWKVAEVLLAGDASFRALVEQSDAHGQFRFCVERYFGPADEDEGTWPDGCWQVTLRSGLYDSHARAVKEAQASLR